MSIEQRIFDNVAALLIDNNLARNVDRAYEQQFDEPKRFAQLHESVHLRFSETIWQDPKEDDRRPQYGVFEEERIGVMTLEVFCSYHNAASAQHTQTGEAQSKNSAWLDYALRDNVKKALHNYSEGCGYFRLELIKEDLYKEEQTLFVHRLTFVAHVCAIDSEC